MDDGKPVGVLLRVSTNAQANMSGGEVDIPTQRTACMRFIQRHPNWVFQKEYMEVGVSGYKNTLAQRDRLLEVKEDIAAGRIRVLVVFMFDRLGRREEETPFIVKSFVEMGCEVWSVQEGQRTFEAHVDSLLNFITFWQASGESKKTSERVTNAMNQMAESGRYTGGLPPYGYHTVETGRTTKKKLPEKKLAVREEEAEVVRLIFRMALTKGYGVHRIAQHLNRQGVHTRTGRQWRHSAVGNILNNPIYKGYKCYNRTTTKGAPTQKRLPPECWIVGPRDPGLVIVPEEDWDRLFRLRQQRVKQQGGQTVETGRGNVKSRLLLAGLAYCGDCGAKLYTGYSPYRWTTKDGAVHRRSNPVYRCGAKSTGRCGCGGPGSYTPGGFESAVIEVVGVYLDGVGETGLERRVREMDKEQTRRGEKQIRDIANKIQRIKDEIKALEERLVQAVMGEGQLSEELLINLIAERETTRTECEAKLSAAKEAAASRRTESAGPKPVPAGTPVWREVFASADIDRRKVLIRKMIDRVDFSKGGVKVRFNLRMEEFLHRTGDSAGRSEQA